MSGNGRFARHPTRMEPMITLTRAVHGLRSYNLQIMTNIEENPWSRGAFMKSALAGVAGCLIRPAIVFYHVRIGSYQTEYA